MPIAPDLCGLALDGRYELHAVIGEGTFGRVYRGRDRRLDRVVAVKVIKPWWAEDPEWVAVFERETRMLARLSDPGIVQIHDVGHAREGLYYVSELVDGENLAQRLRRGGRLPTARAREIALGLCHALAGAHAQRIVHRDVKPANVLLQSRDGAVKLGDFGVARLAEGTTDGQRPSTVVGTPRYMAPEQGRGGQTSPATDVYGVGIVLYEMLTGTPPFTADSPVALALSHLNDPLPPLDDVPAPLAAVVTMALAKDPGSRYPDAGAMARALQAARVETRELAGVGGRGAGGPPSPPTWEVAAATPGPDGAGHEPTRPAPRLAPRTNVNPSARRRTAALLGLVGGVLAALVIAAVLTSGHHHRLAVPRVEVPLVVNENLAEATERLHKRHLKGESHTVAAPGIRPGTVTRQRPGAGRAARRGSVVHLSVAEVPRFRTVTSLTDPTTTSTPFRVRGSRWRILSTVSSSKHCSVLFLDCHGTSAAVLRRDGSTVTSVGLGDGTAQPRVFSTGPGIYSVRVDPGSGDTRWTITIQDDY